MFRCLCRPLVLIQHLSLLTNIVITLSPPATDWVMPLNMTHKLWCFFKKPSSSEDDTGMLSIFLISHMKLPTLHIRKAHEEVSSAFFETCWFNENRLGCWRNPNNLTWYQSCSSTPCLTRFITQESRLISLDLMPLNTRGHTRSGRTSRHWPAACSRRAFPTPGSWR